MSRVLIAGCGDIGNATGLLMIADGHEVFGIRRRTTEIAAQITAITADLSDPSTLRALPDAVDVLIYSAAADDFNDQAYERAYVSGLRNVLAAVDDTHLQRVIFVSSTSVYAQDDGSWVDEDSPTRPGGFSGKRLLQGEAIVAALECTASIVRFAGIYGPGRTRLLNQVRAGARCRQEPVQWTNRIHRDDCAGVLRHVCALDEPRGLYLGVDCEPVSQCEVLQWLARSLGAPQPVVIPAGEESPSRRRGGNKRCSNRRLLDSGYSFEYPGFRQGYGTLLSAQDPEPFASAARNDNG